MLILITGLPSSGKTTFAKALAYRIRAKHVNSDVIRGKMGLRGSYIPAAKKAVYQEMLKQVEAFLLDGQTVIVDATFYKEEVRKPFMEIAEKNGFPLKWIGIKAEENTIKERVEERRRYSEADYEVYLQIKKNYEPLEAPHLDLFSDDTNLEEMVGQAVDYLSPIQIPR